MGGLAALTLDGSLASNWHTLLQDNGLNVQRLEGDGQDGDTKSTSNRLSETLWQVDDGSSKLRIGEVHYHDRDDGIVHVFFAPFGRRERPFYLRIQEVLVAAGAALGAGKRR
jgi:hypothetical protein